MKIDYTNESIDITIGKNIAELVYPEKDIVSNCDYFMRKKINDKNIVYFSKRINIYFTNENDRMKFDDWFDHQLWFCSSEEIFDRIIEHLGDSYYSYSSKEDCIKSIQDYIYPEYD